MALRGDVADDVAEDAEGQHGQGDQPAGRDQQPGRPGQGDGGLVDHAAPGGAGRRRAEAQEGQSGLDAQGDGGEQRGLDDDDAAAAGQDVPEDHPDAADSEQLGGGHVEFLTDRHGGAAHDAERARGAQHAEGDHRGGDGAVEDGEDGQQDHDRRHGHHEVADTHHDPVEAAAEVSGGDAEGHGGHQLREDAFEHARQGGAAAVEQSAEKVPAEGVGAEPVVRGRCLKHVVQVLPQRVGGGQDRCRRGGQDQQEQEPAGERAPGGAQDLAEDAAVPAVPARRCGCRGGRRGCRGGHVARTLGLRRP